MKIISALIILTVAQVVYAKDPLQLGTCQREITPVSPNLWSAYQVKFGEPGVINHTDPIFIAGFGDNRRATGYGHKLWARGVVIDSQEARVALVALDLIGYSENEVETIRGLIKPVSGIDYLIVHSTNQHQGPDSIGLWGPDPLTSGIDYGYIDFVNAAVADCVDEAVAGLQAARVKFATTDSIGLSLGLDSEDDGFGVADGKVLVDDDLIAPSTEGRFVDPKLSIMQFSQAGGMMSTLATVINFGNTPESLGSSNTLITSDFPNYVRERIEAEFGGMAIWTSGAMGALQNPLDLDVQDPDNEQPAARRTFRWSEVYGNALAERAIESIGTIKPGDKKATLSFASSNLLPVRLDNPYYRFFIAIGVLSPRRSLYTNGAPDSSVGFPFPPPFDTLPQALGEDVQTEVGVLRIGEASVAIVPTRVDPQISELYRQRMVGAKHTFIIGNGNDSAGEQLPKPKWDDSCHFCAPFILAGVPQFCPLSPNIDCNVVFQQSVGQEVDPSISQALLPLIDSLHSSQ